ncbi:unnamed protein product [Ambrosiozyma monospora]|uniref:Unnamed protein product n=1 Tax=Ambrosiozyma monospora TaxID=43982 RepID=A0ACB5U7P3_AMBMO|nr:unnamed protein product [Ambrosiozyma monospora]
MALLVLLGLVELVLEDTLSWRKGCEVQLMELVVQPDHLLGLAVDVVIKMVEVLVVASFLCNKGFAVVVIGPGVELGDVRYDGGGVDAAAAAVVVVEFGAVDSVVFPSEQAVATVCVSLVVIWMAKPEILKGEKDVVKAWRARSLCGMQRLVGACHFEKKSYHQFELS